MTRLIDADALMDKISSETIFIKDGLWVSKIIADAPTIEPSGEKHQLSEETSTTKVDTSTNTSTDLISRAEAIEAIQNAYCKPCKERGDDYNEVRCRACAFDDAIIQIDALPSAEPKRGEWIPVDERLPEDGQGVLVTVDANKWNIEVGSCIYSGGTFHSKLYDLDVIAWQPLPTPYNGAEGKRK